MNNKKRIGNYNPWNKGLTKETDPRVKRIGQKISESNKGHIAWNKGLTKKTDNRVAKISGSNKGHTPWNKGLTKEMHSSLQKVSILNTGRCHSEEQKKKWSLMRKGKSHNYSNKGFRHSKETKKRISEANKGRCGYWTGKTMSEEAKNKMRVSHQKYWKNEQWIKKWRISLKIKPTKPEIHLDKLLKKWLPHQYKYVGDFSFMIGGKNPDFMNINSQKKLIELYGDYWHRNDDPEKRIQLFRQYGFDTIIVWQHELKNEEELRTKVTSFHRRIP